jgi:hypothetical protein
MDVLSSDQLWWFVSESAEDSKYDQTSKPLSEFIEKFPGFSSSQGDARRLQFLDTFSVNERSNSVAEGRSYPCHVETFIIRPAGDHPRTPLKHQAVNHLLQIARRHQEDGLSRRFSRDLPYSICLDT